MNLMSFGHDQVREFPSSASPGSPDNDAWQKLVSFVPSRTVVRNRRVELGGTGVTHWDELRTRTALTMAQQEWHVLGVTAPREGCGTTTVALNLAAGLSRQNNCRVVLLDLDLRKPSLHAMLHYEGEAPLAEFLLGRRQLKESLVRLSSSLAVGLNTAPESCPSEVLLNVGVQLALAELRRQLRPDVVVIDLPAMLDSDEVLACLPMLDCVLLVAEANRTTFGEVDMCERELSERSNLLGVALNKCRDGPSRYGY